MKYVTCMAWVQGRQGNQGKQDKQGKQRTRQAMQARQSRQARQARQARDQETHNKAHTTSKANKAPKQYALVPGHISPMRDVMDLVVCVCCPFVLVCSVDVSLFVVSPFICVVRVRVCAVYFINSGWFDPLCCVSAPVSKTSKTNKASKTPV